MDLMKDTIYEQFKNLEFKDSKHLKFEFNDLFHMIADSSVLISITNNKILFLKNCYGKTGELGTDDLLGILMGFLYDSLSCDIKLFKKSFLDELNKSLVDVLTRHGISMGTGEIFPDESNSDR